ncbi:MAG: aldo/keto reductase [Acidobacteriota bacterium]|nr:aldo/keto reductase [Acidobacteriota bacterium]
MEYVNFGKAGIKVSRLALGLGFRGQADEAEAQRNIEHAIDQGINLIDCANVYGPLDRRESAGRSEVILGKALKGKRDAVVITSKVASSTGDGPNDRGLSRVHIIREVERSLTRLNTDYIDVYLAHVFDESTPLEETVRAFDDLVRSGKVRYAGCCNFTAWQVCKALWIAERISAAPFICVQNPYHLLNRDLEREMFGLVRDQGLGVMVYSPLAIGLLSGIYSPDRPPPSESLWATAGYRERFSAVMQGPSGEVVSTVIELAKELGRTPAQLAIAWVLSHSEVTVTITGGDTIDHLDDSLGSVGWTLDDSVRQKLDVVSAPDANCWLG